MSEAENKSLARRLLEEVVNTGEVERLSEFISEDCTNPLMGVQGWGWFRDHVLNFRRCYPDLVVTVDGQIAEGETVVTWWTMRGTHSGEWGGLRPTHKRIVLHGVNIQKFRNGRIVEKFGASNSLEALLELGVVQWAAGQQGAAPNGGSGAAEGRQR
ncbi:MAG: ester cyclase [Verrucomicrobiota bacterium]